MSKKKPRAGVTIITHKPKTVLALGDLHCGHVVGLTPPQWQQRKQPEDGHGLGWLTKWNKYVKWQREAWRDYFSILKEIGHVDILLVLGDCIEGKGRRSGGTELITTDRSIQVRMACECLTPINADKIVMVYGTDYHQGEHGEDWENEVAEALGVEKIGAHEWVEVNGCVFDIKHFIGSSSVPHGRGTPLARAAVWNALWNQRKEQPKADVILRAHVHYYYEALEVGWRGCILPALQGMGSKYGARKCEGTVDWGVVCFHIQEDGRCTSSQDHFIHSLSSHRASPMSL